MKKCGIYRIWNRSNGKSYVGQSNNIRARWAMHRYQLRKGIHPSRYMQRAWNKSSTSFEWEIIEECEESNLCEREDFYIGKYKSHHPEHGYNTLSRSEGRVFYPECSRKKMSDAKKGMYLGKDNPRYGIQTPQHVKDAAREANSRSYVLVSPSGVRTEFTGLKLFCKANGLDRKAINMVIRGLYGSHHGWTRENPPTPKSRPSKSGALISPSGDLVKFDCISRFSAEHGLHASNVTVLLQGKVKTAKGWTLPK